MLSQKKSLNILKKTNALLEGHFVLSSGLHSSKYIQCAKLLSFPHIANKISCFLKVLGFSIDSFSACEISSAGVFFLSSSKFICVGVYY